MAPPARYTELGKDARELFTKHFHIGVVKLDGKVKSNTGVHFNAVSSVVNDSNKASGFLEMKYKIVDFGATLKQKWTTDNTLSTEIFTEDRLLTGLKLTTKLNMAPQLGKYNAMAGAALKREHFHATADLDYTAGTALVTASLVHMFRGFLTGCMLGFRPVLVKPSKVNLLCGYSGHDLLVILSSNDFKDYNLLIHSTLRSNVQAAVTINYESLTKQTLYTIGAVFKVADETTLRAKVNSAGLLGLSLTHRLREGIDLTMCAAIDIKNYATAGHKFGLGVNLEA